MSQASNLAVRIATAAVGVPVILALIYVAPAWGFYGLCFVATLVGVRELLLMTHHGDTPSHVIGMALAGAASVAMYTHPGDSRVLVAVMAGIPVLGPIVTLFRLGAIETAALRALAMGFAPLYVAVPLTLLGTMRVVWPEAGPGLVLLSLGLGWFADSGAYFAGRFLGRRKLYEAVSPKKTVEGALGGVAAAVVWALFGSFVFLRGHLPVAHAVALAVAAGSLGQAGDLGESLLKRSTGVKDSGAIVPGHGGILDRVDAVIVTSVSVFLYASWGGG